jgi:protein N-terminal asparagine amidohydrolase
VNDFTTRNPSVLPPTLAIPINTSGGSTETIRFNALCQGDGTTVDELIAKGYFPALSLNNKLLQEQNVRTLLNDIVEEVEKLPKEKDNTLLSSSSTKILCDLSPSQKVLYVAQGELAHSTAAQADILMSDRATTCHILALRSSCGRRPKQDPALCSIAHLDATSYNTCIYDAIKTHYDFHTRQNRYASDSDTMFPCIELDIHVVGGFKDTNGTSQTISTWILNMLADMADVYYVKRPSMAMILRTACITAANHDQENGGPIIRGLALNCDTGTVFVANARYPRPAMNLRMAKVWLSSHSTIQCDPSISKLNIIHTHCNDFVEITPLFANNIRRCRCGFIQNQMQLQFRYLLGIQNDNKFLQFCSTSPEHEEDDFCKDTRSSLFYILKQFNSTTSTNSPLFLHPLRFSRLGANTWVQIQEK